MSIENQRRISWRHRGLKKLRVFAHRISPNLILHPNETSLRNFSNKDAEENLESRLPEGEDLSVSAIWAVEVYGPSEVDSLYQNLVRLGWDNYRIGGDYSAVKWINEQRMYGSVGNFNIGVVTRRGDNRFLISDRIFAVLPPEVDYLLVYLYQLSASLTCLRIGFVIKDEFSNGYRDAIEKEHKTQRVVQGKGRIYYDGVINSKIKEISTVRVKYRKIAADWVKKELPGFFCRAEDENKIPTAELVFTKKELLFGKDEVDSRRPYFDWRRIIVNPTHDGPWTAEKIDGLQLVMDEYNGSERYHTVIALQTSLVSAEKMQYRGEPSKSSYISLCEDYLGGALVYIAGLAFLREIGTSIKVAREELQLSNSKLGVLKKLRIIENFLSGSIGKPSIATELLNEAKWDNAFRHWCENFTATRWRSPEIISLPKVLAQRTVYFAEKFIAEEATAREQFEQLSSILNTRESIKTQARMEKWTLIAIFLALASLFAALLALAPISEWPAKIADFFASLRS